MKFESDARVEPQTRAPSWKWLRLIAAVLSPRSFQVSGFGRLHDAVRFAFPQRNAISIIVGLTLCVAGLNAIEPLILKFLFDELADMRLPRIALRASGASARPPSPVNARLSGE